MKTDTRRKMKAAALMNPGYYSGMTDEEIAQHGQRDNGQIPYGPVVGTIICGADVPDQVDDRHYARGEALHGHYVVCTRYTEIGRNDAGEPELRREVVVTDHAVEPKAGTDARFVQAMTAHDEGVAALVEAGATAEMRDALNEIGA